MRPIQQLISEQEIKIPFVLQRADENSVTKCVRSLKEQVGTSAPTIQNQSHGHFCVLDPRISAQFEQRPIDFEITFLWFVQQLIIDEKTWTLHQPTSASLSQRSQVKVAITISHFTPIDLLTIKDYDWQIEVHLAASHEWLISLVSLGHRSDSFLFCAISMICRSIDDLFRRSNCSFWSLDDFVCWSADRRKFQVSLRPRLRRDNQHNLINLWSV